jgi:CheY-like chemotaxis protein
MRTRLRLAKTVSRLRSSVAAAGQVAQQAKHYSPVVKLYIFNREFHISGAWLAALVVFLAFLVGLAFLSLISSSSVISALVSDKASEAANTIAADIALLDAEQTTIVQSMVSLVELAVSSQSLPNTCPPCSQSTLNVSGATDLCTWWRHADALVSNGYVQWIPDDEPKWEPFRQCTLNQNLPPRYEKYVSGGVSPGPGLQQTTSMIYYTERVNGGELVRGIEVSLLEDVVVRAQRVFLGSIEVSVECHATATSQVVTLVETAGFPTNDDGDAKGRETEAKRQFGISDPVSLLGVELVVTVYDDASWTHRLYELALVVLGLTSTLVTVFGLTSIGAKKMSDKAQKQLKCKDNMFNSFTSKMLTDVGNGLRKIEPGADDMYQRVNKTLDTVSRFTYLRNIIHGHPFVSVLNHVNIKHEVMMEVRANVRNIGVNNSVAMALIVPDVQSGVFSVHVDLKFLRIALRAILDNAMFATTVGNIFIHLNIFENDNLSFMNNYLQQISHFDQAIVNHGDTDQRSRVVVDDVFRVHPTRNRTLNTRMLFIAVEDSGIGVPREMRNSSLFEIQHAGCEDSTREWGVGLPVLSALTSAMGGGCGYAPQACTVHENCPLDHSTGSVFWLWVPVHLCHLDIGNCQYDSGKSNDASSDSTNSMPSVNVQIPELTPTENVKAHHGYDYSDTAIDSRYRAYLSRVFHKTNAIVCDPKSQHLQRISTTIRRMGFTLTETTSGRDLLEMFEPAKHRFILMDAHMPDLNGCMLAAQIRKRENKSNRPVIIFGFVDPGSRANFVQNCYESGIDEVFHKPLNLAVIASKLVKYQERIRNLKPTLK